MAVGDHNAVVHGESQSGESAMINYIRTYASQEFSLHTNAEESGILPHTAQANNTITNPLGHHRPDKGEGQSSCRERIKMPDEYNNNNDANKRKDLNARTNAFSTKTTKSKMANTLGDTTDSCHKHVQKILDSFNKPKTVHLHLTTMDSGPLAQGLQGAIEFYKNKFSAGSGTIPGHTHLDFKKLRPLISLPRATDLAGLHITEVMALPNLNSAIHCKKPIDTQDTAQNDPDMPICDSQVDTLPIDMAWEFKDSTSPDMAKASDIDQTVLLRSDGGELLAEIPHRDILVSELGAGIKASHGYFVPDIILEIPKHRYSTGYEAKGGEKSIQMPPQFVCHVKSFTAKSRSHPECKKLIQGLQEASQRRNNHLPLIGGWKLHIKEIVKNHGNIIQILGFVANVVPTPEEFHVPMRGPVSAKHQKHGTPSMSESCEASSLTFPTTQKYSILILGKTQAGKTALVEHMRSYSTPNYNIDQSVLGDGTSSKTERTRIVHATSSLPYYEVYDKMSGTTIDFNPGEGDEEDIQDLLSSREDNIGVRPAPGTASDVVEFELLDTPGFCNQGNDIDQADIVGDIISTRSFNLILIVVNIHDPLSAEQLLALRYYSKVLHGLHSNIAFLYTHADYGHYLQLNDNQQLALANRTQSLSRIFQESLSSEVELYPSFTISLTEKRLPFVQCLMHNTLRDILQLAVSNPPVLLDTSSTNVERINRIDRPSEFDNLRREMFSACIYEEGCPQANIPGSSPSVQTSPWQTNRLLIGDAQCGVASPAVVQLKLEPGSAVDEEPTVQGSTRAAEKTREATTKSKITVLVLGRTQSGKSSLMQHLKQFADPTYEIDPSHLGDGNTSKTESTKHFFISSNLPAYEVVENATGAILDPHCLDMDEDEFLDLFKGREGKYTLRKVAQDPNAPSDLIEFKILDTPGFNDTRGGSLAIAEDIRKEIIETQSIDLILVTVSVMSPLTQEYRLELEYYAQLLQGLHANIAFLYTHVDYTDCHRSNINHHSTMSLKHRAFSKVFQKFASGDVALFKHFTIDLLESKRPVAQCLLRNTLRDILQLAVENSPVVFDTRWTNLERIQAIVHPAKLNQPYRKSFRARQTALAVQTEGEKRAPCQCEAGAGKMDSTSMAAVSADSDSSEFDSVDGVESDGMDM